RLNSSPTLLLHSSAVHRDLHSFPTRRSSDLLFGGVNDQPHHARELSELIKDLKCHVNLIPVNHVPERNYVRTSRDDIFEFLETLNECGVNATLRCEQGTDIDAACRQLRAKESKEETEG